MQKQVIKSQPLFQSSVHFVPSKTCCTAGMHKLKFHCHLIMTDKISIILKPKRLEITQHCVKFTCIYLQKEMKVHKYSNVGL